MKTLGKTGHKASAKQWEQFYAFVGEGAAPGYQSVLDEVGVGTISGWLTLRSPKEAIEEGLTETDWRWDDRLKSHCDKLAIVAETADYDLLAWSRQEGFWLLPVDSQITVPLGTTFQAAIDGVIQATERNPLQVFIHARTEARQQQLTAALSDVETLLRAIPRADVSRDAGGRSVAALLPRDQVFLSAQQTEDDVSLQLYGKTHGVDGILSRLWVLEATDSQETGSPRLQRLELDEPAGGRFWQGQLEGWHLKEVSGTFGKNPSQKSRVYDSQKAAEAAFEKALRSRLKKGFVPVAVACLPRETVPWSNTPRFEIIADVRPHATSCRSQKGDFGVIFRDIPLHPHYDLRKIDKAGAAALLDHVMDSAERLFGDRLIEVTGVLESAIWGAPAGGLIAADSRPVDEDWQEMLRGLFEAWFGEEHNSLRPLFWIQDPQLRQQEGVLRDRLEQLATAHLCPYTGFSSGLDILDCKTLKQLTLSPDEDFESFSFFGDWGWT